MQPLYLGTNKVDGIVQQFRLICRNTKSVSYAPACTNKALLSYRMREIRSGANSLDLLKTLHNYLQIF